MKCPKCNVMLVMAERQGIEIDYCPECRGVWLDRGELDKIIERSSEYEFKPKKKKDYGHSDYHRESHGPYDPPPSPFGHTQHDHDRPTHHRPHKKKSMWDDLFDFD
jgi:uncharacterized protein